jgi:MFS family permease
MTGVALPLLSREFNIGAAENGLITAATLFGILVGAVGLGGMSDRFGRIARPADASRRAPHLVNAPGANAYPLIKYEYAIVSTKQANPVTAEAIRKFLLWAIAPDETNKKYLDDAHFIALPAHIWVFSHDQIVMIK